MINSEAKLKKEEEILAIFTKIQAITDKESLDYNGLITEDTLAVGIARVGSKDVVVRAGEISELIDYDFGGPLHCIVIPADLHIVEAEYLVEVAGADSKILDDV